MYPKLYNSNAYFQLGDHLFLIDCGESAFRQHYMAGHFEQIKNITVLITHMHTDHIGSLGTLIVYSYLKLGIRPQVIFPEPEKLHTVFDLTGVEPEHYLLSDHLSQSDQVPVTAEFIRVRHHDVMVHSFGILLNIQGQRVYYSGDAGEVPQSVISLLTNNELDYMYQDTSMNDHGGVHCSFEDLKQLIPAAYRQKVYCMHYDGEYFDVYKEAGFQTIENLVDPPINHLLERM